MNVTVRCDRCGQLVEGVRTPLATGGFYDTSAGYWSDFADPDESVLCDDCMWDDPRYIATYRPADLGKTCDRPPHGWYCKQIRNHSGPCPAWPRWWAHPIWWLQMRLRP